MNGNSDTAPASSRLKWLVLTTVIIGTFLGRLDQTVVNLAIPKIIIDFGITVLERQLDRHRIHHRQRHIRARPGASSATPSAARRSIYSASAYSSSARSWRACPGTSARSYSSASSRPSRARPTIRRPWPSSPVTFVTPKERGRPSASGRRRSRPRRSLRPAHRRPAHRHVRLAVGSSC